MRQVKRYAYYYCCHHSCLQLGVRTRQLHTKIVSQPPWSFCGFECFPSTEYLQSYYSMSFLLPTKIMLTGVHQHDKSIQTNWGQPMVDAALQNIVAKPTKKPRRSHRIYFAQKLLSTPNTKGIRKQDRKLD